MIWTETELASYIATTLAEFKELYKRTIQAILSSETESPMVTDDQTEWMTILEMHILPIKVM